MSPAPATPRRIKVLTLVDYLTMAGGAERLAFQIATRLDPERFDAIMAVSRFPLPPADLWSSDVRAWEQLKRSDTRFLALKRRRKVQLAPWLRLERFLRRERVDVLHAHKFGSNVWGTLVGRMAHVPVVLAHEHTWSYSGQPLRRFLDRELVARGADRFIAVSREDQRRMVEIERIPSQRTLFIPNGVASLPPPSGRDVRSELGIGTGVPVIGVIGVLRAQKAHGVMLQAAKLLLAEWPTLQLLIVGDGPERTTLKLLVAELGLQDTVRFLGERTDVPDLLSMLDVAVCCSDFEGSPLSVLEYMDAGLPIVATAVGGIPDLIDDGVHGLLVPPQDPAALAEAAAMLLRAPAEARLMGSRARDRRRTEFDIEGQVRRLEALYLELLEASDRPVPVTAATVS